MALGFAFSRYLAGNRMGVLISCTIQRLPDWSRLRALRCGVCNFGFPWHHKSAPVGIRRGCPLCSVAAHSCVARPPQEVRTLAQEAALSRREHFT